jgi:hypothetical protein
MIIDNDLKWKGHIYGKGGVLSSLNQRLLTLRILSNHIHHSEKGTIKEQPASKIDRLNRLKR